MKKQVLFGVGLLMLLAAPGVFAQETVWDMANSQQYGKKAGGMLGRGLLNVATSFVDVIVQTVDKTQEGPPFVGTLTGLGGGIACTALRVSSGALDVVTFWVPGFNGIPVGRDYHNCLATGEDMPMTSTLAVPSSVATPASEPMAYEPPKERNPMDYVKK